MSLPTKNYRLLHRGVLSIISFALMMSSLNIMSVAYAKENLDKEAVLRFYFVDAEYDSDAANVSSDLRSYDYDGKNFFLKDKPILKDDSIDYVTLGKSMDGLPVANVYLKKEAGSIFNGITSRNIGKQMAVVYLEKSPRDGGAAWSKGVVKSIATIMTGLGKDFVLTGGFSEGEIKLLCKSYPENSSTSSTSKSGMFHRLYKKVLK